MGAAALVQNPVPAEPPVRRGGGRGCGSLPGLRKGQAVRFVANSGRFKGFAYLDFASPDALAVALRKKVRLRGRLVELDFDTGGARAGFKYRPEAYDSNYAPAKR